MSQCNTCGEWAPLSWHRCPPEWEVRDEEYDDEWTVIRAHDADDAATKYADTTDSDCGEGPQERTVQVREKGSAEVRKFSITFDYSIDYSAHEEAA